MTSYMQVRKHPPTVLERYFLCIKCICNMFCRWAARYDDTNTHSIKMLLGGLVHGEVLPRDEANLSAVKFDLKKAPQSQLSILFLSDTRPIWIFLHIWHSFTWFCVKYYTIDSIYIYTYIQFVQCQCSSMAHGKEVRYTDWIRTWI